MAYSRNQSNECLRFIDETVELLKGDPPVGNRKETQQWALGMYIYVYVRNVLRWPA